MFILKKSKERQINIFHEKLHGYLYKKLDKYNGLLV